MRVCAGHPRRRGHVRLVCGDIGGGGCQEDGEPQLPSPAALQQQDGEGTHRPAREALRPRHHPRIQEVRSSLRQRGSAPSPSRGYLNSWSWLGAQIQADPSEHQGGRGLVRQQEDGLRLQGQDQATTPTTTTSGARSPSPTETLASSAPSSPSLRPW